MTPIFCTIITPDYFPYVQTQLHFLKKFNAAVELHVFITTKTLPAEIADKATENLRLYTIEEVCGSGIGKEMYEKYFSNLSSAFRWAMKPVIMKYLLVQDVSDKIIYIDWDILFYDNYSFLFDLLNEHSVIITPHWTSMRTKSNLVCVVCMYNAGFVGMNKTALDLLDWWANECLFKCEDNVVQGYYVDQSYLQYFHLHEGISVHVVKHRGCNVASWNMRECRRIAEPGGKILINDKYPIVFIHYTMDTVAGILEGRDNLLLPYFEEFSSTYALYNNGKDLREDIKYKSLVSHKGLIGDIRGYWKKKVRLRARIRNFIIGPG